MTNATLSYVSLASIDPNPFRDLKTYPYNERKLESLMRSINGVGLWESLIGRRSGRGYQLAFGHHRLEAARRCNLTTIPLLLRELTDKQMVQFMGRENMEDYNSDFLVMLASWDAAVKFGRDSAEKRQDLDIAILLGWTRGDGSRSVRMNETAQACSNAAQLIAEKYITRNELIDLSVSAVRDICSRVVSRHEMIDKLGSMGKRPAADIERDKKHVVTGAKAVAKDIREGTISHKNIRSEIDYRTVKSATAKGKASPLFAAFAKEVAESIHKMLISDNTAVRLTEMEKALPHVTMEEDHAALRRIDFALAEHEETTASWRRRLARKGQRVIPFKLLKKDSVE